MLREEKPVAIASPEPNPEDGIKKKRKKKKKNIEISPQPNENPQPQVSSSEPLVVTPISEFNSNEESIALPDSKKIKKKKKKKKNGINPEVAQEKTDEPKTEVEQKIEAEQIEGKVDEVMVAENALDCDSMRPKGVQNGAQPNVEPAETANISVVDREVSLVDLTILLENQVANVVEAEQMCVEKNDIPKEKKKRSKKKKTIVIDAEVAQEKTDEPKPLLETEVERIKEAEPIAVTAEVAETTPTSKKVDEVMVAESAFNSDCKRQKVVQNGAQSNEHNVELAETTKISVVDREVSLVDQTILLENQVANVVEAEQMCVETNDIPKKKKKHSKKKKEIVIDAEVAQEKTDEPKPSLETEVERIKEAEPIAVTEEAAETTPTSKKKKKRKSERGNVDEVMVAENALDRDSKRQNGVQNGVQLNEHNVELAETTKISVVDREVSLVDQTILLENQIANVVEAEQMCVETNDIPKKKKKHSQKKKKIVIDAEVAQENTDEPKPSLETEVERIKEAEPIAVTEEAAETTPTSKKKRKRKSERGNVDEVVVVENALDRDSKRQNGVQLNEHNVEPAETAKVSVVDREASLVDQTILLDNQVANLVEAEQLCPETNDIPKKKKKQSKKKKKIVINAEVAQEKIDEPKPSLETEIEKIKEAEPIAVTAEVATTTPIVKKKRKRKSERGRVDEVMGAENAFDRDLKRQKGVQNGVQPIEHNVEPADTANISVVDREVSLVDQTNLLNNQVTNLVEAEQMCVETNDIPKKKKKGSKKKKKNTISAEVAQEKNDEPKLSLEADVEKIKEAEPIAVTAEVGNTTPTVKKKRKRKSETGKVDEVMVTEYAFNPDLKRQKGVQNGVQPNEHNVDREASLVDPTIPLNNQPANPVERNLEAERKRFTVSSAPNKICWACREPNHSLQQCVKLKTLSSNAEVCFFCGEIGHSLGKCSVYIAGGGRFARCLFCNVHGHFSNQCPGHGYAIEGAVAAVR